MPLYEYVCLDCGRECELLVRDSTAPRCPSCHGAALERVPSNFAASSAQTRQSTLARARQQNLKTETDKAIARAEYERKHAH